MFSKKVLFPMAVVAMASFVACGDDSSSGPSSSAAPASVGTFMDLGKIPCSASQNLCSIVLIEDHNDYYQCNGTQWNMMLHGKDTPDAACANAAPAADPATSTTPAEDTGIAPADTPAETTPATTPSGDKVACQKEKICTEGPADLASECSSAEGETLLDACPAGGQPCDIGEAGITMYFYEGAAMTCDEYKAMIATLSGMAQ